MTHSISLNVNGRDVTVQVAASEPLAETLRRLGLTGTKIGCGTGACGACTVLRDGRRIVSCLAPAASCDGSRILTIEGLAADGSLHALQSAFIDADALQCGYCTPGQIMSACGLLDECRPEDLDERRVAEQMSGNLCRCGAYTNIVAAITAVAWGGR